MKLRSSKAQAALEFLMTYGWAILLLIVAIVMAWQFGLFSISGNIRPGYLGFWGLTPVDFIMNDEGNLSITWVNDVGGAVNITDIKVLIPGSSDPVSVQLTPPEPDLTPYGIVVLPGAVQNMNTTVILVGKAGSRFEILVSLTYTDSRTLQAHKSSGRIWGSYEQ